jgi:peptide deformylase
MRLMQVVQAPDPRLRVKTKPVKKISPDLLIQIKRMIKLTKTFVDPEGVGLASTQVGEDGAYFVGMNAKNQFKAYFNPEIIKSSKTIKVLTEGCLSIPNYWGEVKRHTWVDVKYMNEQGQIVKERLKGLEAHIFQHEVDHLTGKLFMDHILEQKGRLFKVVGKDRAGGDVFEEVPL